MPENERRAFIGKSVWRVVVARRRRSNDSYFFNVLRPRTIPLLARGARIGFTKKSTEQYRLLPTSGATPYGNDDAVRKPVYANTTALVVPAG